MFNPDLPSRFIGSGRGSRYPILLSLALVLVLAGWLGYLPLDTSSDEPRRALIALEMQLSSDYVTPTINGERYFNKPPLYNWLLVGAYWLTRSHESWVVRLPMVLSLFGFGLTVFLLIRRCMPGRNADWQAFVVAMLLLTNARVLTYDSLWASIDITHGWVVCTATLLVYQFEQRRQYWRLFLITYALTAVAFLMKGLPALAFQSLTLLSWFGYRRQLRVLLHPAHWCGIGLFGLLVGSYYMAYLSRNALPISGLLHVLLDESAKRTVTELGVGATLLHLLTFPFEMIYHFAPYSLLLVLVFRRGTRQAIQADPFLSFCSVVFLANLTVYWTSPQVYPRYLIGLLPLLFVVLTHLYYERSDPAESARLWIERIWLGLAVVLMLGVWVLVWHPRTHLIPGVVWKTALSSGLLAVAAYRLWQSAGDRLGQLLLVMIVVRLGFNWLSMPGRYGSRRYYQQESARVARETLGKPLYGLAQTFGDDDNRLSQPTDVSSFHIEAVRGQILRKASRMEPGALYIADSASLARQSCQVVDTLRLFKDHRARLVRVGR